MHALSEMQPSNPIEAVIAWIVEFYLINIDTFLSAGWFVLGALTLVACLDMAFQTFFRNYNLEP